MEEITCLTDEMKKEVKNLLQSGYFVSDIMEQLTKKYNATVSQYAFNQIISTDL